MNNRHRIPLAKDTVSKESIRSLADWLGGDPQLTKGPETVRFELGWSREMEVGFSTFVNSGSSAILLALACLREAGRMPPGSKVVVPALSWLTDASSPANLGYEVVYCDCNMTDLSLDLDQLESILRAGGVSCVILVSVLGIPPAMDVVSYLCKKYGVCLLEDACESLGTDYYGRPLGTWGDYSVFSTYYGHHISTIEGGMVCTDSESLDRLAKSMRSHGWSRDWPEEARQTWASAHGVSEFEERYTFYFPGFNFRATDLQARIGVDQLRIIREVARTRCANFDRYQERLSSHNPIGDGLALSRERSEVLSNFAFPLMTGSREQRARLAHRLSQEGIECRPLIAGSMARQPFSSRIRQSSPFGTPNADSVHERGMYLPNNQAMTVEEVDLVCDVVLATGI